MEGWSSAMLWQPRSFIMAPASSSSVLAFIPLEKARISSTRGPSSLKPYCSFADSICSAGLSTYSSRSSLCPFISQNSLIIPE